MSSSLSFLDLPYDTRLKIYGYSGLIRSCPIELNVPDGHDPKHYHRLVEVDCLYDRRKQGIELFRGHYDPECLCPMLPIQLLFVCRAYYEDSFLVLYTKNRFILRAQNVNDLGLLLVPCVRGHENSSYDGTRCLNCETPSMNPDYALDVTSPAGKRLFTEWTKLWSRVAQAITPGRTKLSFICDVADLDSGKAILQPLLGLPAMKQCTIRLSRQPSYRLNALARDTSIQIMHLFTRSSEPFPFRRLPRELQLYILRYTHLGRHNNYEKGDRLLRVQEGKIIKANIPFTFLGHKCCRKCTETLIDCCCPPARAAFSTTCICRQLPFGLFLVDKQMRQDAMQVFLHENCFDFSQDPEKTIEFLSHFPVGSLKYVRQIQFRFSEKEFRTWIKQDYSRKWFALVTFIKVHFELLQLSIVVVAETFELGCYDDEQHIYDVYCNITRSLRVLGEVRDIRFDLGWFYQLGPLMSRAVAGEGHEGQYPELLMPLANRNGADFPMPHWFREADLIGDADISSA